jgi:HPt (histidine-containing phosphotransfer) domain-containing protein
MTPDDPGDASTENDVIDYDAAAQRIPGGLEGVKALAPTLITECDQQLAVIKEGLETGDAKSVRRGAHTIKGSAAVFSAERVTAAARTMELLAGDNDLEAARTSLVQLEIEVDRLREVVTSEA